MGEKETILIHTHGGSTEMGPKKWQLLYFLEKETINLWEILSFLSLQTVKEDRIWVTAYKIVLQFCYNDYSGYITIVYNDYKMIVWTFT